MRGGSSRRKEDVEKGSNVEEEEGGRMFEWCRKIMHAGEVKGGGRLERRGKAA